MKKFKDKKEFLRFLPALHTLFEDAIYLQSASIIYVNQSSTNFSLIFDLIDLLEEHDVEYKIVNETTIKLLE